MPGLIALAVLIAILALIAKGSFKVIGQAEVMVIERLGRFNRVGRSGMNVLVPFIDRARTIDVRIFDTDVNGVKRVTASSTNRILALRYFEALPAVAQGPATTVFLPAEASGVLGALGSLRSLLTGAGAGAGRLLAAQLARHHLARRNRAGAAAGLYPAMVHPLRQAGPRRSGPAVTPDQLTEPGKTTPRTIPAAGLGPPCRG